MPDSLRGRLTLAVALLLVAFLGLAGLALDRAFQRSVEAGVRDALLARVYLLLGAVEIDAAGQPQLPETLAEPRLGSPDSGLYAAIRGADGEILWRSDSSVGREIPYPSAGAPGEPVHAQVEGMSGGQLHALAYPVIWELETGASLRLEFLVAESGAGAAAQVASFRRTLWSWFAALAVLLLVAQAAVLRWGLAPLQRAAAEVAAIEAGTRERLGSGYPRELRPLTQNLNALLSANTARLQRYRDALSDLGHSLKTPIAVLRAVADEPGMADQRDTVRQQADRMENALGWHLQRAAAAGAGGLTGAVALDPVIERIAASLQKVHAEKSVTFERDLPDDVRFQGDPEDLMEIVGNLLDNAWKWCAGHVRIEARRAAEGKLAVTVADDGPGIAPGQRRAVLERGMRGDERVPGQGLGLDIVRQMVEEVYAGRVVLDQSDLGGLAATVVLPGSPPDAGSPAAARAEIRGVRSG